MKSAKNLPQTIKKSLASGTLAVDFGEEKTVPTECREKCFQMTSYVSRKCGDIDDSSEREVS